VEFSITLILFTTIILPCSSYSQEFNMPESAVFDPVTNRYFVSNFGNGSIVQIDSTGEKTYFKKGLSKPLSILIHEHTLYVVNNPKTVRGFDITDGSDKLEIEIEEASYLNDITVDNSGFIYVTGRTTATVYKIDINSQSYSPFIKTKGGPNGITYDKSKNRLLVCYFAEKATIDEINLEDSTISTLIKTKFTSLDGITLDEEGNCYISE